MKNFTIVYTHATDSYSTQTFKLEALKNSKNHIQDRMLGYDDLPAFKSRENIIYMFKSKASRDKMAKEWNIA